MQKVFSNLAASNADAGAHPDVPWWLKYAGKAAGIIGGVVAILSGVFVCLSITPICIVAGIWQILAGFLVIVIEAPFCCMFLDFVSAFSNKVEARPLWQKAALYLGLSLPSLAMCLELSTLLGSGCIFTTAVIYGMMTLGKKASREEMAAAAGPPTTPSSNDKSGLVGNIHMENP